MVWGDLWQSDSFGRLHAGLSAAGLVAIIGLAPVSLSAAESAVVAVVTYVDASAAVDTLNPKISADLGADELIQVTAETLLGDIREHRELYADNPSKLYVKVREWVFPHFDFQRISRYVLGAAWKEASPEVQQQFESEFSTLMLHTYGSALLAFQDDEIEFLPYTAKADATMATVKTQVRGSDGSVAPVDYRLGKHTGQWKVLDVKIDGISMIKTYRSEYGSVVKRQGLNELVAALAERNQRNYGPSH